MRGRLKLDALLLAIESVILVELLPRALRVLRRRSAILWWRGLLRIRRRGPGSHPPGASQRGDTIATTTARVAATWCQHLFHLRVRALREKLLTREEAASG